MDRPFFSSEQEIFRDSVRAFIEAEMVPYHADWEKQQRVPLDVCRTAGEAGLLCCDVPEAYGGSAAELPYTHVYIKQIATTVMTRARFLAPSAILAPDITSLWSAQMPNPWFP